MRRGRIGIGKERIKVYPGIMGEPVFEKKKNKNPLRNAGRILSVSPPAATTPAMASTAALANGASCL